MNGKLENVENEVQELRAELEAARARTAEYETALQDLDRQQSAAAGRLELARRQAAEYSARLETRESELAEARRREETYDAFRAVVERRDVAGLEAAGAIDAALDRLAAFGRLQAAIPAAREEVAPATTSRLPPSPKSSSKPGSGWSQSSARESTSGSRTRSSMRLRTASPATGSASYLSICRRSPGSGVSSSSRAQAPRTRSGARDSGADPWRARSAVSASYTSRRARGS